MNYMANHPGQLVVVGMRVGDGWGRGTLFFIVTYAKAQASIVLPMYIQSVRISRKNIEDIRHTPILT